MVSDLLCNVSVNVNAGQGHVASDLTNLLDSELLHCFLGWNRVSRSSRSMVSKYKGCTDRLRWLPAACPRSRKHNEPQARGESSHKTHTMSADLTWAGSIALAQLPLMVIHDQHLDLPSSLSVCSSEFVVVFSSDIVMTSLCSSIVYGSLWKVIGTDRMMLRGVAS